MNTETLVDRLLDGDVLQETADGLAITDEFRVAVDEFSSRIRESGLESTLAALEGRDDGWAGALEEGFSANRNLQARFLALAATLPELSGKDLTRILFVMDAFEHPPEHADGSPSQFLPVRGDRFGMFAPFVDPGIVYVWQEDCDPCNLMVEAFDSLPDEILEEAVLLSIYGPGSAEELYEAFEVGGAPTTLFLANGRVDSRLMGAHPPSIVENEIRIAAERAGKPIGTGGTSDSA